MKRIPYEQRLKLVRLAAGRYRKRRRRAMVLKARAADKRRQASIRRQDKSVWRLDANKMRLALPIRVIGKRHYRELTAPTALRFTEDHRAVCEFVERIRVLTLGDFGAYLNFTDVKRVGPAAALYLAAEMDRMRFLRGNTRWSHIHDFAEWDPGVANYLDEIGLYDILKIRNRPAGPFTNPGQRRVLKMRRETKPHQEKIPGYRRELEQLVGRPLPPDTSVTYSAILEAIMNVMDHAYVDPDPRQLNRIEGAWWWTAAYDDSVGELQLVLLDQGAGIPVRLPHSKAWGFASVFLEKLGMTDDASSIRAALEYRRSSVEGQGRGRGFRDIMELVESSPGSYMRILSGRGECIYLPGQDIQATAHPTGVVGTIVQWNLRIG